MASSMTLSDAVEEEKHKRDAIYGHDKNSPTALLTGILTGGATGSLAHDLSGIESKSAKRGLVGIGATIGGLTSVAINNHKARKAENARQWLAKRRMEKVAEDKSSYYQPYNNNRHVSSGQALTNAGVSAGLMGGLGALLSPKGVKGKMALLGGLGGASESLISDGITNLEGGQKTDAGRAAAVGTSVGLAAAATPVMERALFNRDAKFRNDAKNIKTSKLKSFIAPDTTEAKEVSKNLANGSHYLKGVGKSMLTRGALAGGVIGGVTYGLSKLMHNKDNQ